MKTVYALVIAAGVSQAALAAEPSPMTFSEFDTRIANQRLANCPDALAGPRVFCCMALGSWRLSVFAFSADGDKPMVGAASYNLESLDSAPPDYARRGGGPREGRRTTPSFSAP